MNRKQRRASVKRLQPAGDVQSSSNTRRIEELFADAVSHQNGGRLDTAAELYKQLLRIDPDQALVCNKLACIYTAQGKLKDASKWFARSLTLMPQLLDQYGNILTTLGTVVPAIGVAVTRAERAWPIRLPSKELLKPHDLTAIADDPLLLHLLCSQPVREIGHERLFTAIRFSILRSAAGAGKDDIDDPNRMLKLCGALAIQCYLNEYVFSITPEESDLVENLKSRLIAALETGTKIPVILIVAVAMYVPLNSLPNAHLLLKKTWPQPAMDVMIQQIREPQEEFELRKSIRRLTAIEDDVSMAVRQQYEENPYPRWVHAAAAAPDHPSLDEYLRTQFPWAAQLPLPNGRDLDVLIAGCGTGKHPIEFTQKWKDLRVLAVDLSLASLCCAKRKTPKPIEDKIEYAQADILKLGSVGRTFDVIDSSGVLHHLADPMAGLRVLLSLLRPCGLMHLGFYSEAARRDIYLARAFIAEHGYSATAPGIRQARQALLATPLANIARFKDFFSLSECRDLLFHVQENCTSIPAIKSFIVEHGLSFIGFEFETALANKYRAMFVAAGWSMTDLDRWHEFETKYPDTFSGMYQFWVQKG